MKKTTWSKIKTFFANFFREGKEESMMRLLSFTLVYSGVTIVFLVLMLEKSGAHYGLELAVLGVIGKSYQKGKELEIEKPNNDDKTEY